MRKKYLCGLIFLLLIPLCSLSFGINYTESHLNGLGNAVVRKTEIQGAWIIIAGGLPTHSLQNSIDNGCNITYQILKDRGYSDDDIYYLGDKSKYPSIVDNYSTLANIKDAIEKWAPLKCSPGYGLGIYMFDHGSVNKYYLPSGPNLSASDLAEYLNYFQMYTGCDRNIIIYEACHSGSFIGNISKNDRIVITSTNKVYSAYPNFGASNAAFSEGFWRAIEKDQTVGVAFQEGVKRVGMYGYSPWQFPLIDDNHDKIGNQVDASGNLPNNGDGSDALNTKIGTTIRNLINIKVKNWPLKLYFDSAVSLVHFWVKIHNETPVNCVYARVIHNGWSPVNIYGDVMEEEVAASLFQLDDSDGDGNYTGSADVVGEWNWNLTYPDLKVSYIATGQEDINSDMESTNYSMTSDGNPPPDVESPTVWISNPAPDALVSGIINISVRANDDQRVTNISLFIDDVLVKNQTMPDYYPFELEYQWNTTFNPNRPNKITAVAYDEAGHVATTSIFVNLPENPIPSFGISVVIIGCFFAILVAHRFYLKPERFSLI